MPIRFTIKEISLSVSTLLLLIKVVELGIVGHISDTTIYRVLKNTA